MPSHACLIPKGWQASCHLMMQAAPIPLLQLHVLTLQADVLSKRLGRHVLVAKLVLGYK